MIKNNFNSVKRTMPFLVILGLFGIFLRQALSTTRSFAIGPDNEYFIGSVLAGMSTSFSQGEWPTRLGELMGGVPLYNFSQLTTSYPFYFWYFPWFDNPIETMVTMHWVTVLHVLIFQVGCYLFLRKCSLSVFASIVGASIIAFSANTLSYANWMNITAPYAWLPFYLFGLTAILNGEVKRRYFFIGLSGIVLLTLASPAQPLIHAIFLTFVFIMASSLKEIRKRQIPPYLFRSLITLMLMGVVAILLTAHVLIPTLLEYKDMIRWLGPFGSVVGNTKISFEAFLFDQLEISQLAGLLFPMRGVSVGSQYVGVITCALALTAIFSKQRNWVLKAAILIAVYSLLSSMGSNLGLAYVNYEIPFLNKIREPSRFLFMFNFAIGVLAAYGVDKIRGMHKRRLLGFQPLQFVALMLLIVISTAIYFYSSETLMSKATPLVTVVLLVVLVFMTMLATRFGNQRAINAVVYSWGAAALMLLAVEVGWQPQKISNSHYLNGQGVGMSEVFKVLKKFDDSESYRIVFGGDINDQHAGMLAVYHGLRTLNVYFNPLPNNQFRDLYYHGPRPGNYHKALGIKYLICKDCAPEDTRHYELVEGVGVYEIYQTKKAFPRTYVGTRVAGQFLDRADFQTKVARLDYETPPIYVESQDYDRVKSVLLDGDGNCVIANQYFTSHKVKFDVDCAAPAVVGINEYFDGNWTVAIGLQNKQVMKINGNQLGVLVPRGKHEISLRYQPKFLYLGYVLAAFGVLIIALLSIRWPTLRKLWRS